MSTSDAPRDGSANNGDEPLFRSGVRPTSRPPGPSGRPAPRAPTARVSLRPSASPLPIEPLSLDDNALALLRFSDRLEDESVAMFWIGVAGGASDHERERAVQRWWDWATPEGVPFADSTALARAANNVLDVLDALAHRPERTAAAPTDVLPALARAMRAWTRAREGSSDPALLVGGIRVTLEAIARGAPEPSAAERNILSNALRKYLERTPAHASSEALHALTSLDPEAPVLAPFAESILDLLLLDADLRGEWDPALAECARMPWWPNAVRWGFEGVGRAAIRAARLLSALSANPQSVDGLPEPAQRAVRDVLPKAIAHNRFSVWSRCARSAGKLAGVLPGVAPLLQAMLEPTSALTVRRRAHAALGSLSFLAPEVLTDRRALLDQSQTEPWQLAALAIALPDQCDGRDDKWTETARALAARGGPETWTQLAISLREISSRSPNLAHAAGGIALSLKALIDQYRPASPAETELADRAHSLIARVGEDGELSPWQLLMDAAQRAADAPDDPSIAGAVEEFIAHTEQSVASALKAVGLDHPRAATRAGIVLEEVLDLVVDGEILVVAERIADAAARRAALEYAEALRARLLRTTWMGLRRPTPNTVTWRRWLLRAAAVLPRIEPHETIAQDRERVARGQVLETLERVADDPSVKSPTLQRYVVSTLTELCDSLRARLGETAVLSALAWMAVRGGEMPLHNRVRRSLDGVPAESIDKLYFAVDKLSKNKRAEPKDLADLASVATARCRLGTQLAGLAKTLSELEGRKPEMHWSGLPKFDLATVAALADGLKRSREHAIEGLTADESAPNAASADSLEERAQKLNRALTSTSLKFVDAARRAEIVEQYVADLGALSEAIATACGPVAGPIVRAALARALIAVRAQASQISEARAESVRFIGRLKVLGPLGSAAEGGMASTWLAEGPAPGKRVVVKLLPWDRYTGGDAETTRKLFEGEMATLASVVHPNVVSLVDAGFVDEGAYIAVELIPGASLETILRAVGPIDVRFLQLIIRDAARGLAHLHARGIIHRDVKPGNILVQLDGLEGELTAESLAKAQFVRAVMIDLGIAAEMNADQSPTIEESLIGTPGYLAPEIARGLGTVSPALDVYALGVVAFEALTGTNPYLDDCEELTTVLVRHGTMPLPIDQLPRSVKERETLVKLLEDACALDPNKRPNTRDFLTRWVASLR
ncbi:MAG: serine/threonine-protein kinase [Polyangiales bacterium]